MAPTTTEITPETLIRLADSLDSIADNLESGGHESTSSIASAAQNIIDNEDTDLTLDSEKKRKSALTSMLVSGIAHSFSHVSGGTQGIIEKLRRDASLVRKLAEGTETAEAVIATEAEDISVPATVV